LSLLLCDIDNFKQINDTYGHAGGDQILRQFGPRLKHTLRQQIDWVARIGGEEFAIVMPETTYESAREVARRLRRNVEQTPFTVDKHKLRVTASFGLCGMDQVPRQSGLPERLLKIADAALYRSKHDGRNRVTATTLEAASALP
jgi:diguanylate cyclase (GGDEF)-like protein